MYPHERSLVKQYANRPFAILGVNSDKDREFIRGVVKKKNITWRSFWNGPLGMKGPIAATWNVRSWPTIYVIDHQGVIRFKLTSRQSKELDEALEMLVAEAEAEAEAEADIGKR